MSTLLQIDWYEVEFALGEISKTFYAFPVHIQVLMGIAVLFLIVILLLLAVIISSRIYKTNRKNRMRYLKNKYQPVFMKLLFEDEQHLLGNDFLSHFDKKDLKQSYSREIIKDEIIHLHENFTGETATRLELLFVKLEFHLDSLKMLKNRRWYIRAKGMKELALMNIREAKPSIFGFLNSKNEILRMEARIAMMKLSESEPLEFLSQIVDPLNDWDQSNIHAMLTKMPETSIPDFSRWLTSPNKSVMLFAIRMIGAFRQQNDIIVLTRLLSHPDEKIKIAIVQTLRDLNAPSAESILISMYAHESVLLQHEILQTLSVVGKEDTARLMEKILKQAPEDYSLAIQAVRTLLSSSKRGLEIVDAIFEQGNAKLQLIIQHAKDKRL